MICSLPPLLIRAFQLCLFGISDHDVMFVDTTLDTIPYFHNMLLVPISWLGYFRDLRNSPCCEIFSLSTENCTIDIYSWGKTRIETCVHSFTYQVKAQFSPEENSTFSPEDSLFFGSTKVMFFYRNRRLYLFTRNDGNRAFNDTNSLISQKHYISSRQVWLS